MSAELDTVDHSAVDVQEMGSLLVQDATNPNVDFATKHVDGAHELRTVTPEGWAAIAAVATLVVGFVTGEIIHRSGMRGIKAKSNRIGPGKRFD